MKKFRIFFFACALMLGINGAFAQMSKLNYAFSKSHEYEATKDYGMAINIIKDNYDAQSYESNLRLGWLYYKTQQYKESMIYYSIASGIMPNALEAKVGYIYPVAAVSDIDRLIVQYKKILEIDPLDINSNYQMGFYYYNKNDFASAKKYFEKVISLYPSGYETYLRNAWAKINNIPAQSDKIINAFAKSYEFEYKSDYTSAIAALKDIYDPQYYDVNLRLGWLSYQAKLYKESANYYQIAINLKPNAIEPRFGYIYPATAMGNLDNASEQYKKILEIHPKNTYADYGIGMIYYNKNDYKTAYQYFEKGVELYPFTYDSLLMYAWSNYQTGKVAEAKSLFNKVLMLAPKDTSALKGLSLIK